MNTPKVGFISLGWFRTHTHPQLRSEGYAISPSYQDAELVVVNTCGFIDSAVEESLDAIGEALSENGKVIVTGCLGAKKEVILAKYPNVLSVTGPQAYESMMQAVYQHLPRSQDPFTSLLPPQGIKLTPRHYAYIKIAEGCNHKCSFCIIPSMRGKLQSRPIGDVMNEAEGKLLPYLDIPLQHANARILKLMKRPADSENNLARITAWRKICLELALRSTFIVGFPGETEQEFSELLDFLQQAQLERVGCFKYSAVEGAKANDLPDAVPEEVKQERYERFMALQAKISADKLQAKIGKTLQVLVDEVHADHAVGRSSSDAPEIDGQVIIDNPVGLKAGEFAQVKVSAADTYDLFAEQVYSKS